MQWEIEIIRALQKLSCGFFDALNIALTQLGDEIFFMAVAVLLYWCFDKKFAYKFMNVYLFSVAVKKHHLGIYEIVELAYPGEYKPWEFSYIGKGFWKNEENIVKAIK